MFAPLANDVNGLAFELPNDSKKWRVIASSGKKGPGKVLRDNGLPLEVEIDSDVDEFKTALEAAGHAWQGRRYRLQAVNADGCDCCDTAAVLEFDEPDETATGIERRNAAPAVPAETPYRTELQAFLASAKDREDGFLKAVRDLSETVRRRDDDTLRTLREALKVQTESNSLALKALVKSHVGPHAYAEPQVEEVFEEEQPEPPSEQSAMEMVQKLLVALPQIMDAVAFIRKAAPAAQTAEVAAGAANGVHVNGVGIHPAGTP
jgi:hypothetical protein